MPERYDNRWKQGDILSSGDSSTFGLIDANVVAQKAVIITHDCDLPYAEDNTVEVIIAKIVDKIPLLTGARNPRKLHLTYSDIDGSEVCLELSPANKKIISNKQLMMETMFPETSLVLTNENKRCLKQWLASIYGRPAFPNEFENRIKKEHRRKKVEQHLSKILNKDRIKPDALFFDLGNFRHEELAESQPYVLNIFVVYDTLQNGVQARVDAEEIANEIKALFHDAYGRPEVSNEIALEDCIAIADTVFTLASIKTSDQWRLEYISLQETPPGNFIGSGEVSV